MAGQRDGAGTLCPQCGSDLAPSTRFCAVCGHAITTRAAAPRYQNPSSVPGAHAPSARQQSTPAAVELAGGPVRSASFLLDLAAMISPAMPLSAAGAVLGVAEVVYIVVPVAFVAVWMWMQIWQGLTGNTFGKVMLGLRLVRDGDHRPPGVLATVRRSLIFVATLGLAGLPVLMSRGPQTGFHDRISGLVVLDVTIGANPLGPRQQTTLRRPIDRSLNRIQSPVPVSAPRSG